jgi:DNA-binding transcriptional MerR regulator
VSYRIGDVAKACGMTVTTLRSWERRYGFPRPQRDDRGNRFYSITDIVSIRKALIDSKGKALLDIIGEIDEQTKRSTKTICDRYATLTQRLLACLRDGPDAWLRDSARQEREACLEEARKLAVERSQLRQ